jgi:hypothetical protein
MAAASLVSNQKAPQVPPVYVLRMGISVRALLLSEDNPSAAWVGEYADGPRKGFLTFAGGQVRGDYIIPAMRRTLQEETCLPADAFCIPHVRPVLYKHKTIFCLLVWLKRGFVPTDSGTIVRWQAMSPKELLVEARLAPYCKALLVDWLARDDCPFIPSSIRHSSF